MAAKTFFVACAVATAAVGLPTAFGIVSEYLPVPTFATVLIPAILCALSFYPGAAAKQTARASAVCDRVDISTVEVKFVQPVVPVVRVSATCEAYEVATVEAESVSIPVRVSAVCERTDAVTVEAELEQAVIDIVRVSVESARTDAVTVEAVFKQFVAKNVRVSVVCERNEVVAVGEAFLALPTFRVNATCARGVNARVIVAAYTEEFTSITATFAQQTEIVLTQADQASAEVEQSTLDWTEEEKEEDVIPKRVVISSVVQRACRVAADSCSISSPVRSRASSICSSASKENVAIFGVEVSDIADSWGVECTTPKSTPPATPTKVRSGAPSFPPTPVSAPRAVLSPLRGLGNGSSPAVTPNRISKGRGTPNSGKKRTVGASVPLNYGGVAGW